MIRVVTIIVTYNGSPWIKKCLEHLIQSAEISDIMIVDNNSIDNTIEIIESFNEKIELIRITSNLGFGGANNIGIQRALETGYSHIFLLNQDAYVQKDCISKLLSTALKYPQYGIISPIQLNPTGTGMDEVFNNQIGKYYSPDPDKLLKALQKKYIADVIEVKFVGAAAWMLSSELIKKVGLFHPVFFHYGEDNNFAARAQYFGYKIGIQVRAAMIHDRKTRDKFKFFLTKLRTFPLHQLLDIRKPLPIAWMIGYHQLRHTWRKVQKASGNKNENLFLEIRKWFFADLKKAKAIRKDLKKGF
ncbi:glycosyltransferase family 2 protein [Shivajiella indica]|uniref:Glycosyltransferase family 2 protein n=1 Tax=Shivajiella indica TaxID=872115 RepID=A0ABW5BG69_9BACT